MGRKGECIVNIYGRLWGETGKRGKEGKLIRLGKHDKKDKTKKIILGNFPPLRIKEKETEKKVKKSTYSLKN